MALLTYKAALSRLFPRDDESSHWMLRLAMIRQDLKLEVSQIALSENVTRDDLFRTTYFLRRISISILEAESVMARDLRSPAEAWTDGDAAVDERRAHRVPADADRSTPGP
jgi:hypothetical protein